MKIVIGVLLVILGLAIGFVITWFVWAARAATNVPMSLFIGLLLLVAGGLVGFIVEWLIDEAYRKNRELRRQLGQAADTIPAAAVAMLEAGESGGDATSETLADFLRRRDERVQELREQVESMDHELDRVRDELEEYQQTHPDNLTVIKGIGPVYQWKLRDVGIHSYAQLASADPEQLQRMLDVKEWQKTNIESWIQQAGDWAQKEA